MSATTEPMRPVATPASHECCVMCGPRNRNSLRLAFHHSPDGGVFTSLVLPAVLEGYAGRLHGGAVAALLDSSMAHCLFARGIEGVTGELRVRYRLPAAIGVPTELSARVVNVRSNAYRLRAELRQEGGLVATARATFVETSI